MAILRRLLNFDLPTGQSAFLWGPRKTGKTTFLKEKFPNSVFFDFLKTDLAFELAKRPALLRERLLARDLSLLSGPVVLDEVQKVPGVLDEVQWLIENKKLTFVMCGSSARKLKRGRANLLGGRAWRYEMFPLVSKEIGELDLVRALDHGLVPDHYFSTNPQRALSAYVQDYLKEEVFAEGLTRNVPAFARFFDAIGFSHGEIINFSNIARDAGVDAKTVREYFQILVDTLLGRWVEPFAKRPSRQIITRAPKFYLFDVGVANAVAKRRVLDERGETFGRAFEHFIFQEIAAHASYSGIKYAVRFWRTKSGQEVDFILGDGEVAIEVKGASRLDPRELRPLVAFQQEYRPKRACFVSNEREARVVDSIRIYPWREFLEDLWAGQIIA